MWTINKNIATYRKDNFCMVEEIKLIEEPIGLYKTNNESIYMDTIKDQIIVATAMRELGEKMEEMGLDNLKEYTCPHKVRLIPTNIVVKLLACKSPVLHTIHCDRSGVLLIECKVRVFDEIDLFAISL